MGWLQLTCYFSVSLSQASDVEQSNIFMVGAYIARVRWSCPCRPGRMLVNLVNGSCNGHPWFSIHPVELLASLAASCCPHEHRRWKARGLLCAKQSRQVCATQKGVSRTGDRRSDTTPGFGSLALVDMAKALVLLANSPILETRFAQVTGLTA